MNLTHIYLLETLDYNSLTGHLKWRERPSSHFKPGRASSEAICKTWNKRFANKIVGSLAKASGYLETSIDSKKYLVHRLAYFHYYGYLPENDIDHKDRIRTHNWIDNLREVSRQCNMRNAGMSSNNISGVKGVCVHKTTKKYQVYVTVNYERINLGLFENFDEAVLARWKGEVKYNFPNCNTSSSSYNYLKKKGLF